MSFILKTIRDSDFGQILDPKGLGTTPLAPLKNLDFFQFWPPS